MCRSPYHFQFCCCWSHLAPWHPKMTIGGSWHYYSRSTADHFQLKRGLDKSYRYARVHIKMIQAKFSLKLLRGMLISECAENQPVFTKDPLMATSSFDQSSRLSKREVWRKQRAYLCCGKEDCLNWRLRRGDRKKRLLAPWCSTCCRLFLTRPPRPLRL